MTNLRSIDLNLLLALKALIEEKSVSRAAEKMCMSSAGHEPCLAQAARATRRSGVGQVGVGNGSHRARASTAIAHSRGAPGNRKDFPAAGKLSILRRVGEGS